MKKFGIFTLLTSSIFLAPQTTAHAVLNGIEMPNNKWAVAIVSFKGTRAELCSGVLVETTTVMTAKHCVADKFGKLADKVVVTAPQSNFNFPIPSDLEQQVVKDFKLASPNPDKSMVDKSDIAALILPKPFSNFELLRIAMPSDVASLHTWSTIKGYGYGGIGDKILKYSPTLRQYDLSWGNDDHSVDGDLVTIASASSIGCAGDSGGPITAFLDSKEEVLLGVAVSLSIEGSNGCGQISFNQLFYENFNLIYPHLDLIAKPVLKISPIKKSRPNKTTKIK